MKIVWNIDRGSNAHAIIMSHLPHERGGINASGLHRLGGRQVAPAVFAAGGVADWEEHRRQDRRRYAGSLS
jgi:hypothetical protein